MPIFTPLFLGVHTTNIALPLPPPTEQELNGHRLYGEDFTQDEINEWFEDERNAYANLGARDRSNYRYSYHALNARHGFRHLPKRRFPHVLGVGSAYGDEFAPIKNQIGRLTIVEPSLDLWSASPDVPVEYRQPSPSGVLPVPSESIDLVLCISVLHHIPNVSFVISEIARVLKSGGFAILREPTTSMGDWRKARRGLTPHERGIPLHILRDAIGDCGLEVLKETRCMFSLTPRFARLVRVDPYNSATVVFLDEIVCRLFAWNWTYHATHLLQRFRPVDACFVLARH